MGLQVWKKSDIEPGKFISRYILNNANVNTCSVCGKRRDGSIFQTDKEYLCLDCLRVVFPEPDYSFEYFYGEA
jgi:hypothetical protein